MTCNEAHEHLLDAVQDRGGAIVGLDEHLRSCAKCALELESMRQMMALLDAWEAPEPSRYFDSRLRARVRELAAESRNWWQWLRKPVVAFALAVLMIVSITLFRNAPNHEIAKNHGPQTVTVGTAVGDLQELEHDGDMYANFDMLDDLGAEAETANP